MAWRTSIRWLARTAALAPSLTLLTAVFLLMGCATSPTPAPSPHVPSPTPSVAAPSSAVSYGEAGYVATGTGGPQEWYYDPDAPWTALTWVSADGMTWRLAAAGRTRIGTLADGPAGTLGFQPVAKADGIDSMGVWRLERVP